MLALSLSLSLSLSLTPSLTLSLSLSLTLSLSLSLTLNLTPSLTLSAPHLEPNPQPKPEPDLGPTRYKAAEAAMLRNAVAEADVVITTALIPNRPAPVLVGAEAVATMRRGSVMVDLAAENGGNIEGTVKDKATVTANGVTILGYTDLVSRLPTTASNLFGNNAAKFLLSVGPQTRGTKGAYAIDYEDEAVRGMLVVDKGVLTYPAPPYEAPPPPPPKAAAAVVVPPPAWRKYAKDAVAFALLSSLLLLAGLSSDPKLSAMLTTFSLAGLAGFQAVKGVRPALHSPLMSVTNAISGMTAVGGILLLPATAARPRGASQLLGAFALLLSSVNIAGGFLVTRKMLGLFRRPDPNPPAEHGSPHLSCTPLSYTP